MDRIEDESVRLFCPELADVFVRRQALEGFQPPREVVSCDEVGEMRSELIVIFVVDALDSGFLDRAVQRSTCPLSGM